MKKDTAPTSTPAEQTSDTPARARKAPKTKEAKPRRVVCCAWCGTEVDLTGTFKPPVRNVAVSADITVYSHKLTNLYGCSPACEGEIFRATPVYVLPGSPTAKAQLEQKERTNGN